MSDLEEAVEGLRLAARPDRPVPAAMEPYLDKVRGGAYRVTDGDVDALRAAGFSEDEIFGYPFSDALQLALRGPSDWSPGERELFAGFTSLLNRCHF